MIVYEGLKTDFLASCERDSIAKEVEENILAKMGYFRNSISIDYS